jgi:hypothetical protein
MGMEEKARNTEEHWFHEKERKLLEEFKKKREARIAELAHQEGAKKREELKKQHWMCCPKCGHDMRVMDLKGVQVDICSHCEGLFFDRGEIEMLVNKSAAEKRSIFRKFLGFGDE